MIFKLYYLFFVLFFNLKFIIDFIRHSFINLWA